MFQVRQGSTGIYLILKKFSHLKFLTCVYLLILREWNVNFNSWHEMVNLIIRGNAQELKPWKELKILVILRELKDQKGGKIVKVSVIEARVAGDD
jgi:hypothetical protein